ncbi:hypothetical protein BDF19DRAFT_463399 [Syncephalis fuscata]|nr:hypothetical protein BDF19DRAFT_463399 [Syncephalis fuscata]
MIYSIDHQRCIRTYNQTVDVNNFAIYWSLNAVENTISFAVQSKAGNRPGWIGFGFSSSGGMVGSRVVVAAQDTSNKLTITEYQLNSKSSSGLQAIADNSRVTSDAVASFANSQPVTLAFTHNLNTSIRGLSVEKNSTSNLVIASGNAPGSNGRISIHTTKEAAVIMLNSPHPTVMEVVASQNTYIIIHGILMAVGWLVLVPVGIVFGSPVLRRRLFPNDKSGNPPYTRAHRHVQTAAFLCITASLIIAKVQLSSDSEESTHGILGVVVYSLLCLQVIIGITRVTLVKPKAAKNTAERLFKRFKQEIIKSHMILGNLLWTLAVANIMLGIALAGMGFGLYIAAGILALLGGSAFVWSSYIVKQNGRTAGWLPKKDSRTDQSPLTPNNQQGIETAGSA